MCGKVLLLLGVSGRELDAREEERLVELRRAIELCGRRSIFLALELAC